MVNDSQSSALPRWLIKLGFHLLYHQLAWSYDVVAWMVSLGQWAAWRRLALQFVRPGPVLELAYGTGGLFVDMVEAGYRPVGVDLSPYMARLAGERLRRRQLPLRLSRARAQTLPFPDGHFSNVIATFPTNYIFEPATLADIYRVLRGADRQPPGRLIIVVEGHLRGPWPLRPLIDWLYRITDQHKFPEISPLALFEQHSFAVRWEMIEHAGARARLLLADKR